MRSGDALRRDTLRMAESAIYNAEKRDRRSYSDDEVAGVVAREVKTRRESVEAFRKGGREDLAAKEESEIAILSDFLPEQLGPEQIAALVADPNRRRLPDRRELARVAAAAASLVLIMTLTLGIDLTPGLNVKVGDL